MKITINIANEFKMNCDEIRKEILWNKQSERKNSLKQPDVLIKSHLLNLSSYAQVSVITIAISLN